MTCVEPIDSIELLATRQLPGDTPTTEREFMVTWSAEADPLRVERAAIASAINWVFSGEP
mgnify:CR=1